MIEITAVIDNMCKLEKNIESITKAYFFAGEFMETALGFAAGNIAAEANKKWYAKARKILESDGLELKFGKVLWGEYICRDKDRFFVMGQV